MCCDVIKLAEINTDLISLYLFFFVATSMETSPTQRKGSAFFQHQRRNKGSAGMKMTPGVTLCRCFIWVINGNKAWFTLVPWSLLSGDTVWRPWYLIVCSDVGQFNSQFLLMSHMLFFLQYNNEALKDQWQLFGTISCRVSGKLPFFCYMILCETLVSKYH